MFVEMLGDLRVGSCGMQGDTEMESPLHKVLLHTLRQE